MFGIILFIILSLGLLKNYEKWLCISIILLPFLMPINLWGQTVPSFLGFVICLLYPFNKKKSNIKESFILTIPLLLLTCAYILANLYSSEKHNGTMISYIINHSLIIVVFFYTFIKDKYRMLPFFIKACTLFGAIVGFYSIFETITNNNPFMQTLMNNNWIQIDRLVTDVRFGMKRSQGIFAVHGTNGSVAIELAIILIGSILNGYTKRNFLNCLIIFSLIFTVFASGTRSAILALIICSITFINPRTLNLKYFIWISVLIFFAYIGFNSYFKEIFYSFIDTESVGGSNTDMRQTQFNIALFYFLKSPIYGNGLSYCANHIMGVYHEMFGAESLWFPTMIDTGILGVLGFFLFFVYSIIYCIKNHKSNCSFFILGFFILNTMSSIPGFIITWIFPSLLILMECTKNNKKETNILNYTQYSTKQ